MIGVVFWDTFISRLKKEKPWKGNVEILNIRIKKNAVLSSLTILFVMCFLSIGLNVSFPKICPL